MVFRVDPDGAPVELDDLLAHREADSAAGVGVLGVQPLEDHEHLVGVLRCDADAVVGDGEPPQFAVPVRRDVDLRRFARAAELDGVAYQVLPEHAHLGGVGEQGRQRIVGDLRSGLLDADAQLGQGPFQHLVQVDVLVGVVQPPDPGEVEQVVDEGLHAVRPVDREVDVLVGPAVELPSVAPLEELGEAGDLAQRLLQVVGGHVRELLQLGVGALEVRGLRVQTQPGVLAEGQFPQEALSHEVDLMAEAPQVGGTGRGDGVFEVTAGDGTGVRAEPLQRRVDAAAQSFEDQGREDGDEHRDGAEHPVPQGHRVPQVVPHAYAVRTQLFLLAVQGGAYVVEGRLALRRPSDGRR